MKERPILFSAPMVRALLAGTKTQTRRVLKPGGRYDLALVAPPDGGPSRCPYGVPGDRLWVREAIRLVPGQEPDDGTGRVDSNYEADGTLTVADAWPWKRSYLPSMHCPRGLSRMTLEVTAVRVERLQDISEADAQAEGCALECMTPTGDDSGSAIYGPGGYRALWDDINGAGAWDANPYVWAVSFRRID